MDPSAMPGGKGPHIAGLWGPSSSPPGQALEQGPLVRRRHWLAAMASWPLAGACSHGAARAIASTPTAAPGAPGLAAAPPSKPAVGRAAVEPLAFGPSGWKPQTAPNGSILPEQWAQLPLMHWLPVATNMLDDVVPRPRYPTFHSGSDGAPSIINAWCGAAWDHEQQRMYLSGGGHADSHYSENGIYELDANSLRFSVAMPRSAMQASQYFDEREKRLVPGIRGLSANSHLADDTVAASHTYDSLVWVSGALAGNRKGAVVMFSDAVGVVDLDSRRYDTLYYDGPSPVDMSYRNCVMDSWLLIHMRHNNQYRLWDLRPGTRSATSHHRSSRGAYLGALQAGTEVPYGHRLMVRFPERREVVVIHAGGAVRCSYGAAIDDGQAVAGRNWVRYHQAIRLESEDGSHQDFADPKAWLQQTFPTPLFAAGGTWDAVGRCVWVQTNLKGGPLYKLTGIESNRWQVQKIPGVSALHVNPNGTYQRCQLVRHGDVRLLLRVSSTTSYAEVCRVA